MSSRRRRHVSAVVAFVAGALALIVAIPASSGSEPDQTIQSFTDPTVDDPRALVEGADGNLWFTNRGNDSIGRITATGEISNFTAAEVSSPDGLVLGPDDHLWFTNRGNDSIGRITTSGTIQTFADPGIDNLAQLTAGPDGNVWFRFGEGDFGTVGLARISPLGAITVIDHPDFEALASLTAGPDGNVWVVSAPNAKVLRVTPAGVVTSFPSPVTFIPTSIMTGPDGNLWVGMFPPNVGVIGLTGGIGRITPDGATRQEFTAPGVSHTFSLRSGADGNVWFANQVAACWFPGTCFPAIGRVTPAGQITLFQDPLIGVPVSILPDDDGDVWFTRQGGGSVGRLHTDGTVDRYTSLSISMPRNLRIGPDDALWFLDGDRIVRMERVDPPGAPQQVTATAGDRSASVTWEPPDDDGGAAITGYTVTADPSEATCTTEGATTCLVSGLTNGETYTFTVRASHAVATSALSAPSDPLLLPPLAPGEPRSVTGTVGDAQVVVSWLAPLDDGGSPVTGYTVTADPGGATCTTEGATTCTVSGLTNGTLYTFTVVATNAVGPGAPSDPSAPLSPRSVPGPPLDVVATAAFEQATVVWGAPATDGGRPVTGYTVTADPGGATCTTGGVRTCTLTGLTNGTPHTFTVVATNEVGPGPASAPSPAVTPASVCGPGRAGPFVDVGPLHPFCVEIEWMVADGITTGFGDGSFRPTAEVTRQAVSAFLWRLDDEAEPPPGPPWFTDVLESHPFYDAITSLASQGVVSGFPDGSFRPGATVTRQAVSAFLWRLAGEPAPPPGAPTFTDVPPSHPFHPAIAWMASEGITTGFPDGTFRPTADVTRQAVSAFLFRFETGGTAGG